MTISDVRPWTVTFINDANGLVLSRDEADSLTGGDPKELHYYFSGTTIGVLTNNGTETATYADDYQTSIGQQRQVPGSGPFYLGASSGVFNADAHQSSASARAGRLGGSIPSQLVGTLYIHGDESEEFAVQALQVACAA